MVARARAAKKKAPPLIASLAELGAWAEDEGWLDDSVVVSARVDASKSARVRIGLRVDDASSGGKRNFNRKTQTFFELSLVAEDAVLSKATPTGGFEVASWVEKRDRFGLELDVGGRSLTVVGKRFRVIHHGSIRRAVSLAFGPDLCFHGPGPVTVPDVRRAIAAAGLAVDTFRNWVGSGQLMGGAFVRDAIPRQASKGAFESALRVVPKGAGAKDARGLWLTGQSLASAAYVNVEIDANTAGDLLAAVVRGLGSLKGLSWASSGNKRIETPADRERWLQERDAR